MKSRIVHGGRISLSVISIFYYSSSLWIVIWTSSVTTTSSTMIESGFVSVAVDAQLSGFETLIGFVYVVFVCLYFGFLT